MKNNSVHQNQLELNQNAKQVNKTCGVYDREDPFIENYRVFYKDGNFCMGLERENE